jgi:hypothetical protein
MAKIIVFSGHGSWDPGKDGYTSLPKNCKIEFYTQNMKTLSDNLGGSLDRGVTTGLIPDQTGSAYSSVPNMRLYPPTGLNIMQPPLSTWTILELPGYAPGNDKNLQVRISYTKPNGMSLSEIFASLSAALNTEVLMIWSACRAIDLKDAGGSKAGVNKMQR